MNRISATRTTALLMWVVATACSDRADQDLPRATLRDSAGITIVENGPLPDAPLAGWYVDPQPSVDIGTLDGDPEYQLFRVRDALRLDDGRLVVLDGGSSQLRFFDAAGTFLKSAGREGEGPGEYMRPTTLTRWPGDSLAIWDQQMRRISVLDQEGALGRTLALTGDGGIALAGFSHVMPDGNLVVFASDMGTMDELMDTDDRIRFPNAVQALDPTGDVVVDFGQHPGPELWLRVGGGAVNIFALPFARGILIGDAGDEVIIGGNDALELRFFGPDGGPTRIVRMDEPPRLVTEDDLNAVLEARLENTPRERQAGVRASLLEHPGSDTLPALEEVGRDARGLIWAKLFRTPAESGPERWLVFEEDGSLVGLVGLPEGSQVFEIGEDYVLGTWSDELDIEHVRLWPLDRGG